MIQKIYSDKGIREVYTSDHGLYYRDFTGPNKWYGVNTERITDLIPSSIYDIDGKKAVFLSTALDVWQKLRHGAKLFCSMDCRIAVTKVPDKVFEVKYNRDSNYDIFEAIVFQAIDNLDTCIYNLGIKTQDNSLTFFKIGG